MMTNDKRLRLMTYNVGASRQTFDADPELALQVIKKASPDVLAIQEASEIQDLDGNWFSIPKQIAEGAGFSENYCFGPTISLSSNLSTKKALFVEAIYRDLNDLVKGNTLFSKTGFVRLGDPRRPGIARNIPIYHPGVYEGNRDTESRYALLARIGIPPIYPFVVCSHFTTILGERSDHSLACSDTNENIQCSSKATEAQTIRREQARRVIDLLREYVLRRDEVVFLLGDFNAGKDEACITKVLEADGGFLRLTPVNAHVSTHINAIEAVDHIFVYPPSKVVDYDCRIIDDDIARGASDHLPVIADVTLKAS